MRHPFRTFSVAAFALSLSSGAFAQDAPPPGAPPAPKVGEGDATAAEGEAPKAAASSVIDDAAKADAEAKKKAEEAAKKEAEAKAAADAAAAKAPATEMAPDAAEKEVAEKKAPDEAKAAINCAEACPPVTEPKPEGPQQGFNYTLSLGLTGSLLHSLAVVGQPDGLTLQIGGVLNGGVLYLRGDHNWETKLNIQNAWTLTPSLPRTPLKSADRFDLSTQYTYKLPFEVVNWLGPYARAQMVSAALPGNLVRGAPTTVQKTDRDGNVTLIESDGKPDVPASFELTSFFEPLVITENVGVTAVSPFSKFEYFVPKARLGLGGQHVIVRDGYAIADDADTAPIELQQMAIQNSLGVNADFEFTGKAVGAVSYGMVARFYYPLFIFEEQAVGPDASPLDNINADIIGTVSFQLLENLKLDYALTVRRIPAVSEDWQVQNSLLVSVGFNVL